MAVHLFIHFTKSQRETGDPQQFIFPGICLRNINNFLWSPLNDNYSIVL